MPMNLERPPGFGLRQSSGAFEASAACPKRQGTAAVQDALEIEVVDAARILATEFEFIEATVAEQAPQAFLGISAFLAELAGEVAGGGGASAMFAVLWRSPLTLTLSPAGEREFRARWSCCL